MIILDKLGIGQRSPAYQLQQWSRGLDYPLDTQKGSATGKLKDGLPEELITLTPSSDGESSKGTAWCIH